MEMSWISAISQLYSQILIINMDSAGSDRPQRRTALVGRELGRYGIEIAALSETRFAEIGEIEEVGAGYTFFWSGRKTEERREAGVGFAIKSDLVGNSQDCQMASMTA